MLLFHACSISSTAVSKFESIGPIYYEYGSMVITYVDSEVAVRAFYTLRESSHEDKTLLGTTSTWAISLPLELGLLRWNGILKFVGVSFMP